MKLEKDYSAMSSSDRRSHDPGIHLVELDSRFRGNDGRAHIPVWFFTNERIGDFFTKICQKQKFKNVFSIGGAGDFAFSLLSQAEASEIEEINLCDIRPMAETTIDLKKALFKNLKYQEIISSFWGHEQPKTEWVHRKIESDLGRQTGAIVQNGSRDDLLSSLKKSGLWYSESWISAKNRDGYLPYLASESRYSLMQEKLEKIKTHTGDFMENLKCFPDDRYNLIYTSNIFDSSAYCKTPDQYLQTIRAKLKDNGLLFVITQNNSAKMVKLIESQGFCLCDQEIHKLTPLSLLSTHYSYSFLLFEK